ncbi:MAG: hypothetical protein HEQ23_09035 [Tepidisphaera sp.]
MGFYQQVHPSWAISQGTFAPRYADFRRGSYPMVPAEEMGGGTTPRFERALAGGIVDLVTGKPLIQEEDFALPFGGAEFRHLRTSTVRHYANENNYLSAMLDKESTEWLDWHGYSWMMSESPVLLVDLAFGDVQFDRGRRCYFVPDAFHAIPFDFDTDNGQYTAPPRFRAGLTYRDGYTWVSEDPGLNPNGGSWSFNGSPTPGGHGPDEFYLHLDGGALTYTFKVVFNSTPQYAADGSLLNSHEQPTTVLGSWNPATAPTSVADPSISGFGVPRIALLKQIEDRRGNRVEIDHVEVEQFSGPEFDADDPTTFPAVQGCFQNTNALGQISRVRLTIPNGESRQTAWTLFYIYRAFDDCFLKEYGGLVRRFGQLRKPVLVDSIVAYEGEPAGTPAWANGFTIPPGNFEEDEGSFTAMRAVHDMNVLQFSSPEVSWEFPATWSVHSRYLYSEPYSVAQGSPTQCYTPMTGFTSASVKSDIEPYLLMRTVRSQTFVGTSSVVTSDHRVYKYTDPQWEGVSISPSPTGYDPYPSQQLSYVFANDTIESIIDRPFTGFDIPDDKLKPSDLIGLSTPTEISVIQQAEEDPELIALGDLADLRLFRMHQDTLPQQLNSQAVMSNAFRHDPYTGQLVDAIGSTTDISGNRLFAGNEHFVELLVLAQGAFGEHAFSVYPFAVIPAHVASPTISAGAYCADHHEEVVGSIWPMSWHYLGRGMFHDPFLYGITWQSTGVEESYTQVQADWSADAWIHVVEEYPSAKAGLALWPTNGEGTPLPALPRAKVVTEGGTTRITSNRPVTRRYVSSVNAAGHMLREKEWTFDDAGRIQPGEENGIGGSLGYDDDRRVIWRQAPSALTESERDTASLVEMFEYGPDDVNGKPSQQVVRTSIKWGKTGTPYAVKSFEHHGSRPELVIAEIQHGDGTTEIRTDTYYEFDTEGWPTVDSKIRRTTVARPAVFRDSSGTQYRPVVREEFDDSGRVVWRGQGLMKVTGPTDEHWKEPADADDFFTVDHFQYDVQGRILVHVFDVNTASPASALIQGSGPAATVGTVPAAFVRQDADNPTAAHECVKYEYGNLGLERTHYPNGKSTVVTYAQQDGDLIESTYPNVNVSGTGDLYAGATAGSARVYRNSRIVQEDRLVWQPNASSSDLANLTSINMARFTPTYDAAGRLATLDLADQKSGEQIRKRQRVDQFGELTREESVEGLVTRTERDYRGRVWRVFRGTEDGDKYWYGTPTDQGPDNMLLVEKRAYGVENPKDCLKVTQVRRYLDRLPLAGVAQLQYDRWNDDQDLYGQVETTEYDWRSRPVRTIKSNCAPDPVTGLPVLTPLSYTDRFIDMLGRERFVATYGATPSALNPAELPDADSTPSAVDILTAAPSSIIGLTENLYDDAGNIVELRTYAVKTAAGTIDTSGTNYLSSKTYRDGAGRVLMTVSSGGVITKHRYDSKGREIDARTLVGGIETSRTISTYDNDGRVIKSERRDRMHNASVTTLDDSTTPQYISTYAMNWYDESSGRLLATADLGTASTTDVFAPNASSAVTIPAAQLIVDAIPNPYLATPESTSQWRLKSPARGEGASFSPALPAGAMVTRYEYDKGGRQYRVIDAQTGRVTEQMFDGFGQVVCKLEYPETDLVASPTPDGSVPRRLTFYRYAKGKLTGIASVTPATPALPMIQPADVGMDDRWDDVSKPFLVDPLAPVAQWADIQITTLLAKADVVDTSGNVITEDPTLVGSLRMPYGDGETPKFLSFTYQSDGKLASRKDQRDVEFTYSYDGLDRIRLLDVSYPWEPSPVGTLPPDRVGRIEYEYDAATLRLKSLIAKTKQDPSSPGDPPSYVVAGTAFAYDGRGNLTRDYQEIGAAASTTGTLSPYTQYLWTYATAHSGGANFSRLELITYPKRPGSVAGGRRVQMEYGANSSAIEYRTGQITRQLTSPHTTTGTLAEISAFKRTGSGLRVETVLAQYASAQRFFTVGGSYADGYPGLDRQGRPKSLNFRNTNTAAAVQYKADYQYSAAGERIAARVTQATLNTIAHDNDRSWALRYDVLGQMIGADTGELSATLPEIELASVTTSPRLASWNMDPRGNWTGNSANAFGKVVQLDLTPIPGLETLSADHAIDAQNKILTETHRDNSSGTTVTTARDFIYDAAGNLVADERFWYQYDGWGRLVQVDLIGTLGEFSAAGRPTTGESGGWLTHYTYDGLGRLVRRQSAATPGPTNTNLRTERYYHDGVRRIQEIFIDPIAATGGSGGGANSGVIENGLANQTAPYCNREYIWGPGDVHGLDEIVAQIDRFSVTWATLQDASGDVVALVKPISVSSGGTVGVQYAWSPAGELMAMDVNASVSNVPENRLGHRALFYDRFESTPTGPPLVADPTSQVERGFFHARNRVYSPWTGRFLQRDPNASGLLVLSDAAHLGALIGTDVGDVSLARMFTDGPSLYGYVRGNPLLGPGDPLGLFIELLGPTNLTEFEVDEAQRVMEAGEDARQAVRAIAGGYAQAMAEMLEDVTDFSASDDIFRGGEDGEDEEIDEASVEGGSSGYYDSQKQWRGPMAGIAGASGSETVAKRVGAGAAKRTIGANANRGLRGEAMARKLFGGSKPGGITINGTTRFYDNFSKAKKFQEVKVGRRDLTGRTGVQAKLDVQFASPTKPVQWVFFTSRRTGLGGPTKRLRKELEKNPNITIIFRTGKKTARQ